MTADTRPGLPSGLPIAGHEDQSAQAIREAVLKREIARLTRERNSQADRANALQSKLAILRYDDAPVVPPLVPQAMVDSDELAALRASLAAKDALIRGLFQSTSWKLTAPVRALAAWLGRGKPPIMEAAIQATTLSPRAFAGQSPIPDAAGLVRSAERLAAKTHQAPTTAGRGVVLVVADFLPLYDQQSGGLRLKTLMALICALEWDVVFCSFTPAEQSPGPLATEAGRLRYENALREIGVSRFLYGNEDARAYLAQSGRDVRYAFISFPSIAMAFIPLVRLHCPWARILYDMVDFHYLRMSREAELIGDPTLRAAAEATLAQELSCIATADLTFAVTEDEKAALLRHAPDAVIDVLPNVFDMPADEPPGPAGRRDLLFVGGFWHKPNGDAVRWFVKEIWPELHREMPDLVFRVVGANADADILAFDAMPNIEILGFVPDLTELQRTSRVFVAPLRYGAGMKGKVGQSLAHGLPVVATPVGAEGMALEHGVNIMVAETPQDFARQVIQLVRDDALWLALQKQGRALIADTLSTDVVRRKLGDILRD